jgi:hypothetical protein
MADVSEEKIGYFYEALLAYAIDKTDEDREYDIHVELQGVGVESDIVIKDNGEPSVVILSTHSSSESGTNMKSWRSIQEIMEVHENYEGVKVINVIFSDSWKKGMLPVMGAAASSQLVVRGGRVEFFRSVGVDASKSVDKSYSGFKKWIKNNVNEENENLKWLINKMDKKIKSEKYKRWKHYNKPSEVETSFKYKSDSFIKIGLIKLSLIGKNERKSIYEKKENLESLENEIIERAKNRNILKAEKGIVDRIVFSDEAKQVVKCIKYSEIEEMYSLVDKYHKKDRLNITLPMKGYDGLSAESFYKEFTSKSEKEMENYFFEKMKYWTRENSEKRNLPLEYLYATGKEINWRVSHRTLSEYCDLPMTGGFSPIPKFLAGKDDLPENKIKMIAKFFSELFSEQGIPDLSSVTSKMLRETEKKIIKHRYVNYLVYTCILKCNKMGFEVKNMKKPMVEIGNGLVKYIQNHVDSSLSSSVANTKFSFRASDDGREFVFLVISAYDSTHKHKEYPGRWRASNVSFDGSSFRWTADGPKCVVILDGIWYQLFEDLEEALKAFNLPRIQSVMDTKTFLESSSIA